MGLADLFKSTKEKEREKKREQRAKEREVENAIERSNDRIKELEKERTAAWEKARTALVNGHKTEAARLVQTYKALGVQISKIERQKTFARNQLDRIAGAADMQNVSKALSELVRVMNLDPDEFEENLDNVEAVSGDIKDMDRAMNKAFEKDQERMISEADAEKENTIEDAELMAALENEAAAGVLGDKVADIAASGKESTLDDINAGRDRLKALLDEK